MHTCPEPHLMPCTQGGEHGRGTCAVTVLTRVRSLRPRLGLWTPGSYTVTGGTILESWPPSLPCQVPRNSGRPSRRPAALLVLLWDPTPASSEAVLIQGASPQPGLL